MNKKRNSQFEIITLNNGIQALIYPQKNVHSISISVLIRAGHLSETIDQNGIAHLLEHMLSDGTKKFPLYQDLIDFYDKIAGGYGCSTTYDVINIAGTFVDEEIENALLVLEQLLFHPLLTQENLVKEKNIILDELSTFEDNNSYQNYLSSIKHRFKGKTILSLPLGGTKKSLRKITRKNILDYHKSYFRPDNIKIIIAGKCKIPEIIRLLKKYFTQKKPRKALKHNTFSNNQFTNSKVIVENKKALKSYIRVTFPSYNWKDSSKDRVTLAYLCSLLTNRRDSLLFKKLREQKGWIYDIDTDYRVGFDIGLLEIETSTPISKSYNVIKEIISSIEYVKGNLFDPKKLEIVKDIDRKRIKMALDTTKSIVQWFSEELFFRYPDILLPKDFIKIYDQITVADIQKVAQEIFNLNKINISVLQPFKNKKQENSFKTRLKSLIDAPI